MGQMRHRIREMQQRDGKCARDWVQRVLGATKDGERPYKAIPSTTRPTPARLQSYVQVSRERILAAFRWHILTQCLSACQPTMKDDPSAVLEEIVRADPIDYKMAIVEDNDPDRTRVMHVVEDTIGTLGRQPLGYAVSGRSFIGVCGFQSISMGLIPAATTIHCVQYAEHNGSSQAACS